jgi:hypothetical protein
VRFLAGVLVGLVAGGVAVFALLRDEEPERAGRAVTTPPASEPPATTAGAAAAATHPDASGEPDHTAGSVIVRRGRGGYTTVGDLLIAPGGEVFNRTRRTLAEIRDALAGARAAADWAAFFEALAEAGAMGTPEARALLVELMGDRTLQFSGPWTGQRFFEWLAGADTPGLLEAALRRAEIDIADNPGSRWRGVGWLSLVALYGGAQEIAWLESLGGGDRNAEMEVDRALGEGAKNPLAAARLAARLKEPRHLLWGPYLTAFGQANPEAAFATAAEGLAGEGGRRAERWIELLGVTATAATLDRARTLFLALDEPEARRHALRALDGMRRRGLDVAGFEPLIDEPRLALERIAAQPTAEAATQAARLALGTIANIPVTRTEAALAAARRFVDHPDEGIAAIAREALQNAEPGGDGWRPERDGE